MILRQVKIKRKRDKKKKAPNELLSTFFFISFYFIRVFSNYVSSCFAFLSVIIIFFCWLIFIKKKKGFVSVLVCAEFHVHRLGGGWKYRRKAFPLGWFVCNQTSWCLWPGKKEIQRRRRCHGGFSRFLLVSSIEFGVTRWNWLGVLCFCFELFRTLQ